MTWHNQHRNSRSFGDAMADSISQGMGSWKFIISMSVIIVLWVAVNALAVIFSWDPYPFILLNLLFSVQAAYSAPIIMMAQNRQSDRDRVQAQHDYANNEESLALLKKIASKLS